ncbi:zinc ribbon domain-containing protein [Flaviflexus massiliensis]|uniref:zinc ribbon domain-containing protein n=1 Tax=Flaviflexus massiliensis TaxID=1522309 RepID=UPI0006D54B49|nr:hypothetical protein [Flaviflexus massiliensis]
MKATAEEQQALIELARIDGELGKLRHLLATLPVCEELAAREEKLATHEQQTEKRASRGAPLEQVIADLEIRVDQLNAGIDRKQHQLDSGEGVDSRQLLVLQSEIDGLVEVRDAAEMEQLEAMELLEQVQADARWDEETRKELDSQVAHLQSRRDSDVAQLEKDIEATIYTRTRCAGSIPAQVIDAYEESRSMGGTGVVVMKSDGTVDGGMDLSVVEFEAVQALPADEVYLTEDTGAIVVREY